MATFSVDLKATGTKGGARAEEFCYMSNCVIRRNGEPSPKARPLEGGDAGGPRYGPPGLQNRLAAPAFPTWAEIIISALFLYRSRYDYTNSSVVTQEFSAYQRATILLAQQGDICQNPPVWRRPAWQSVSSGGSFQSGNGPIWVGW